MENLMDPRLIPWKRALDGSLTVLALSFLALILDESHRIPPLVTGLAVGAAVISLMTAGVFIIGVAHTILAGAFKD